MKTPKLIIFDVNETLLDMAAINSKLDHPFAFYTWFGFLLQYAWVESLSENYRPFGEIGLATLHMAAQKLKRKNSEDGTKSILEKITQLPPHLGVIQGFEKLEKLNIPMVALTNGSLVAAKSQFHGYYDL